MTYHPFVEARPFNFDFVDDPESGGVICQEESYLCLAVGGDKVCDSHNAAVALLHEMAFAFEAAAPEAFNAFFFSQKP